MKNSIEKLADEKLVKKFLEGDDLSFEQLLKRYLKPIYNFLYQITRDSFMAEDLAQETFLRAWKNIQGFDQSKKFRIWLYAIAKNAAYDFLKRKKTVSFSYFTNLEGKNKLEKISDNRPLPNDILEKKDSAHEIKKILEAVPLKYRTILLLHYKQDFSLHEIAALLKKPYNTVKSQHRRALSHFKKKMHLF